MPGSERLRQGDLLLQLSFLRIHFLDLFGLATQGRSQSGARFVVVGLELLRRSLHDARCGLHIHECARGQGELLSYGSTAGIDSV